MVGILYFSSFLLAGFAYYSYFCKQNITYDLYSRLMKYYQYAIVGLILLLCGSLSVTAADVDKHSQSYLSQRIDTIYSYFRKIDLDTAFCSVGYRDLMRQALRMIFCLTTTIGLMLRTIAKIFQRMLQR